MNMWSNYVYLAEAMVLMNTSALSVLEGDDVSVCVTLEAINHTFAVGCDLNISLSAINGKAGVKLVCLTICIEYLCIVVAWVAVLQRLNIACPYGLMIHFFTFWSSFL